MAFPAKNYDRLKTLQKKWGISKEDMFYFIETGILRACIWLPLRYMERGVMKNRKFIYETHEHREGFIAVRPQDCHLICNTGRAKLRIFNSISKEGHILRLAYEPPQPAISVRISDLIVLLEDRQQFEESYDITENNIADMRWQKSHTFFVASQDYRYVKLNGQEFHLGDVQARIVELLHDAAQSQKPWVHGKTLIHESGSNAVRLRDLFKNKENWKELITSNERGYYRLNIPLEELERLSCNLIQDRQPMKEAI